MKYFAYMTPEEFQASILYEDLEIGNEIPGKKRREFKGNANTLPDEKSYFKSVADNNSAGGVKKLTDTNKLLFRKPSPAEIKAGVGSASDIQVGQLYVLSKVLFDFGLLDKVYKAKKSIYKEGNRAETEKILNSINREFSEKYYNEDDPVEVLKNDFDNSIDELEKIFGVRLNVILNGFKTWNEVFKPTPGTSSEQFPKGFNAKLMQNIESSYGDSVSLTKTYKELIRYFAEIAASNKYKTPKDLSKALQRNQKLSALMKEPVVKGIFNKALVDKNVRTVGDFVAYLKANLNRNVTDEKKAHSMTIIHNQAAKAAAMVDLKMKRAGYKNGIADIHEMFEWMKEYEPDNYNYLKSMYGDLEKFDSYSELCDYLYSPEMIDKIYKSTGIKERSRSEGDYRRGQELAVNLRSKKKEKEKIEQRMNDGKFKHKSKTVKEKRAEIEELLKTQEECKKKCKEIGKDNPDPKMAELYSKYKEIGFRASKRISALKFNIAKILKDNPEAENEEPEKSAKEKLEELDKEIKNIKRNARKKISDPNQLDYFDIEQDPDGSLSREADDDEKYGDKYLEFSFTLYIKGQDPEEAGDILSQWLEKYLNGRETYKGYEDLINVDYEINNYEGRMKMLKVIRFIIDYPENSFTYKVLKKNGRSSADKVIDKLLNTLEDKGIDAKLIEDSDNKVVFNVSSF